MNTWILIVVFWGAGASSSPHSMNIEFQKFEHCKFAAEQIRAKQNSASVWCFRK